MLMPIWRYLHIYKYEIINTLINMLFKTLLKTQMKCGNASSD